MSPSCGVTFQVSSVAEDVHAPRNSHHDRVIMSPSVGRPLELFLATLTPRKRSRAKLNPKNGHNPGERLILISKYVLIFLATLFYVYVGESGPLGKSGLNEGDGYKYILVMMEDLSNFAWLEPTESCTAALTVQHLLTWCKTLGPPEVWVSDTASHFKKRVMRALEKALKLDRRLTVANSPWYNETCERMMREDVRTLKAMLQEEWRDVRDWVGLVPAVQWALNTAFRERYASTPYIVMFGRAPRTRFSTLASSTGDEWRLDVLDEDRLRQKVASVVEEQQELHKEVAQRVGKTRELQRRVASRGQIPHFLVGDYVLAARVRRSGTTPKLVSTWTGSWGIVAVEHQHGYEIQNIVNGEVKDAHVAGLRHYADKELEVTADLKEVFQYAFAQGEFEMEAIVDLFEAQDCDGFVVHVEWIGFGKDESSWEPLETILEGAPQFVRSEVRKLRLKKQARARLLAKYGLKL